MNAKEKLRNDILTDMRVHMDTNTLLILEKVLVQVFQGLEITKSETCPATIDNTNQYIKELFMVRKAPKLSPETAKYYLNTIDELIMTINKPLINMTESDVEFYLMGKAKSNSNASLNNLLRNVSAFFTWMRKAKLISDNPCDGIERFTAPEKPIDHLEAQQVELLKNGCKFKRDRALIEFMRCTAMRRGEIPLVKIQDIDFRSGKLLIYGKKSHKYRTVYLDNVALHYIHEYLEERNVGENSSEPLFTYVRGDKTQALDVDGIYVAIKNIARRANIDKNVYPHIFRKTAATNIVKRGGSDELAGEYLGHAPRNVTARHYTYKDEQHVERIFHDFVEAI